ncbi:hypothetical protein UlMin_034952 [Ulmus minor]
MGRAPCCDKANVKRGPWSPDEDATLKSYVQTHGTGGNWIALPKKAGLRRCGKSCRLRWLNYLRPDIKHGGFTEEEDNVICNLYSQMGSRWSVIAARLAGRTDNDVKNYWNTRLKKKLLAGKISLNTTDSSQSPTNNAALPPTSTLTQLHPFVPKLETHDSSSPNSQISQNYDHINPGLAVYNDHQKFSSHDPNQYYYSPRFVDFTEFNPSFQKSKPVVSVSQEGSSILDSPSLPASGCDEFSRDFMDFGFGSWPYDSINNEEKASEVAPNFGINFADYTFIDLRPQGVPNQSIINHY